MGVPRAVAFHRWVINAFQGDKQTSSLFLPHFYFWYFAHLLVQQDNVGGLCHAFPFFT